MGGDLAIAYFTLPAAHAFILAGAPFLVAPICPVAMLCTMKGMNHNGKDESARPGESKAGSVEHVLTRTQIANEGATHE